VSKAVTKTYIEDLYEDLKDPTYAAEYLNAVLEDEEEGACEVFLLALRDVATASTMTEVAKQAEVSRESLYKALSKNGNPKLSTLFALLKGLGLKISIRAPQSETRELSAEKSAVTAKYVPSDDTCFSGKYPSPVFPTPVFAGLWEGGAVYDGPAEFAYKA